MLIAARGDTGATGNYYCGLHEFPDMLFVAHVLRPGDLFLDIGSNIGSYSILAGRGCGARVIACEPVKSTYNRLRQNVDVNQIGNLVDARRVAVGESAGICNMTSTNDTTNHVLTASTTGQSEQVEMTTLDMISPAGQVRLIKIDVEGFELNALRGGARLLSETSLLGVVIELNGSGSRYGIGDEQVDKVLRDHGLTPCDYDPFTRKLAPIAKFHTGGNTIYQREGSEVTQRVTESKGIDVFGKLV